MTNSTELNKTFNPALMEDFAAMAVLVAIGYRFEFFEEDGWYESGAGKEHGMKSVCRDGRYYRISHHADS
jgi:hypothetical protein